MITLIALILGQTEPAIQETEITQETSFTADWVITLIATDKR